MKYKSEVCKKIKYSNVMTVEENLKNWSDLDNIKEYIYQKLKNKVLSVIFVKLSIGINNVYLRTLIEIIDSLCMNALFVKNKSGLYMK